MNKYFNANNNLIAPSILISVSIFLSFLFIFLSVNNFTNKDNSITVTGSTEKNVESDMAKWTITVSERAYGENASLNANRLSQKSTDSVKNYLLKNKIEEVDISIQNINLSPICELNSQGYENCSIGVRGQIATQNILIESTDVRKIEDISKRLGSEVVNVNISGNLVEYYFNGLKDIRVQMLSDATKNAKERAEAVALAGGSRVGNIISLSSGVFQVTQKNSVQYDDYGSYDTSTIEKKVTATVKVNFSLR